MGHAALSPAAGSRLASTSAWVLVVVWLAELASLLADLPWVSGLAFSGLMLYVAFAWLRASRHIRVLFVLVVSVAALIAGVESDAGILVRGFQSVLIFGAFFPAVMLLRATAQSSVWVRRLQQEMGGLSQDQARAWTMYGSHALGGVLNVGAMGVIAPAVMRDADLERRVVLATGAAHGAGAAVMWSPFFVSLAFVSQLVPSVPLWQPMVMGAGLAAMGLAVSHLLYTPALRGKALATSLRALGGIAAPTTVMVGTVVGATLMLGLSGLQAVALTLPLLCLAYLAVCKRDTQVQVARQAFSAFGRFADELLIVVGSMMLGVAVGSLDSVLALLAILNPGALSGWPLLAAMVVALLFLGQFGLHPMIGVSVLVPILAAGAFAISPPVIVTAAVFAWGLSASISIWTLPVAVAATSFSVPVTRLYTRRTMVFGAVLALLGIVYLGVLNAWFTGGLT